MIEYIVLLILVCILLACIYRYFKNKKNKVESLLNKSNGTFDRPAQAALIEAHNNDDKLAEANIIRYNILSNELNSTNKQIDEPQIDDLTRNQLLNTVALDYIHVLNAPDILGRDILGQIDEFGFEIAGGVLPGSQNKHQQLINENLNKSYIKSQNKSEYINTYLNESIQYQPSPQNSHDSQVNRDLRAKLDEMRRLVGDRGPLVQSDSMFEIRRHVEDGPYLPKTKEHALEALNKMAEGGLIMTYGTTETEILDIMWRRAKTLNVPDSIVMALADSVGEQGGLACANGRSARVLNALAGIDGDDGAMTMQMFRNKLYDESRTIMNDTLAQLKESSDANIAAAARSYDDPKIKTTPDADSHVANILRNNIIQNINSYADRIPAADIAQLHIECTAAIVN